MSTPLFNIIVCGINHDFDTAKVKAQFSQMFRLEPAQVERVFNAIPIILRRNIPEDFANSLAERLTAIGVSVKKVNADTAPHVSKIIASKAICLVDHGEESADANAMHQPVEFLYGVDTRRIPFTFDGNGFTYCKIWLINLLVCVMSAGILYPWARARSVSYIYEHTSFDNIRFQCKPVSKKVYMLQLVLVAVVTSLGAIFLYSPFYFFIGLIFFIGLFPYYLYKWHQLEQGHFLFCGFGVHPNPGVREIYVTRLLWPILAILTAGILSPYVAYRNSFTLFHGKYLANCEFTFSSMLKNFWGFLLPIVIAQLSVIGCVYGPQIFSVYVLTAVAFVSILGCLIYWRVNLENLRWNNVSCRWGYFVSSWGLKSYSVLVLQNLLLCLITFGCYWPWAKINTLKYKANHLAFLSNQGFSKWRRGLKGLDQTHSRRDDVKKL
jgi:uncharacterized membrane protein YjgN (DUF898 family)